MDYSQGGMLIQDARRVLNSFAEWSTSYVKRVANQVAHLPAKDALNFETYLFGLESISDFINHIVNMDHL